MGTWKIEIKGTGCHHNGRPDDAEAMSKAFVEALAAAGHVVREASFSLTAIGSMEMPSAPGCEGWTSLTPPVAPTAPSASPKGE